MKFTETKVFNFEGAFRGMRNPMNSWDKSDSFFGIINWEQPQDAHEEVIDMWVVREITQKQMNVDRFSMEWEDLWSKWGDWIWGNECLQGDHDLGVVATLGPNDLTLAQKLILAGPEHYKFLRQIFVSVDIAAPLYWWKEFDTYKVGTVANSTSTMHKLTSAPITKEMFEFDDNSDNIIVNQGKSICGEWEYVFSDYIDDIVDMCENLRLKYIETKDKSYWRALVQILPNAFLQTRTVTMSYANLRNIYFQRRNHKLNEWHKFCDWIFTLPYAKELITLEDTNEIN